MDPVSTTLNVAALAASLLALFVSSVLARRQTELLNASNQVPVILDYFGHLRANGFISREFALRAAIVEHPPELGFSGLPEPLRSEAYEVCLYYHDLSYLIRHGAMDEGMVEAFRFRVLATWLAVRDHVYGERALRGGHSFLSSLEELVERLMRKNDAFPDRVAIERYNARTREISTVLDVPAGN